MTEIQPRWCELWPVGHNNHHREIGHPANDPIHQLERGWIDPVRILENNKHWTPVRKQDQLFLQYLHGPLLLDQFVDLQGRIALSERDRQQSSQKRGSLDSYFRGALQNAF